MELFTIENGIALFTLAFLEIILGIDNVIFIAILSSRIKEGLQSKMRKIGLGFAMFMRIILLFSISWVVQLKDPIFEVFQHPVSWRDIILITGGLFLMAKSVIEINHSFGDEQHGPDAKGEMLTIPAFLTQVAILDIVFSLDSVITAVGMVKHVEVMIAAVVISVVVMIIFANPISDYILKHPSLKMLSLSFLILIGFVLVAEGIGKHIEKGYIYFAIGFSLGVELLNLRMRAKKKKLQESS